MPKNTGTKASPDDTNTPPSGKGSRVSATRPQNTTSTTTPVTTPTKRSADNTRRTKAKDHGTDPSPSPDEKSTDSATDSTSGSDGGEPPTPPKTTIDPVTGSYDELLAALPEADERPARYVDDDGTIVYRASGFGGCERALVAASQDVYSAAQHQEWFQKVLNEGRICEPLIDAMWCNTPTSSGDPRPETVGSQEQFDLVVIDDDDMRVVIRAHVDGMAGSLSKGGMVLREYKKVRPSGWDHFLRSGVEHLPQYPWQVSVPMHVTGYGMEFVGGKYDIDELGNPMIREVHCHHLDTPPIPLVAFVKRARKLERLIKAGFDAREVDCTNSYPCVYYKLHDVPDEKIEFVVPELGTEAGLARTAIATILELGPQIAAMERQKKAAVEQLKGCLEVWGDEAQAADVLDVDGNKLVHVRQTVAAHEVKETTREWFKAAKDNK